MPDIWIRQDGRAGRITLQRPKALNALTYDMVLEIERALDAWRNADIALVLIDAEGDKAFCAGGDIADMYASGQRGDLTYGRKFWRDEYRLNAKIFEYPKPVVSFLQGFTMGGGVGVGCHGSHRIVSETSQIAMPECGIGLVPDVGGSLMLARAPGHLGAYLGTTSARMNAADAIYAGFADHFVPQASWDTLKEGLSKDGAPDTIQTAAQPAPGGTLAGAQQLIDAMFGQTDLAAVQRTVAAESSELAETASKALARNAPLAMACGFEIVHRLKAASTIRAALDQEFRYTYRAVAQGDFIEGIRAAIIDRDRSPAWAHADIASVGKVDIDAMLAPLGDAGLNWEDMP